jgi:hypothetical protein
LPQAFNRRKGQKATLQTIHRHPEVLAALRGEPRRIGHKRPRLSFETPRKRAAPQDDGENGGDRQLARASA